MPVLRLILVIGLVAGIAILFFRVPWRATAELNGITHTARLDDAPFFRRPAPPALDTFQGKLSPYLDRKTVDIQVFPDRLAFFARFAALVVGGFLVFGIAGLLIGGRPIGIDVLLSLALPAGFLGASLFWLLLGRVSGRELPPAWLPYFWTTGLLVALVAVILSRRSVRSTR